MNKVVEIEKTFEGWEKEIEDRKKEMGKKDRN